VSGTLRPATPDDREAVVALGLAEDAAWSGADPVSAEEAGEFIDAFGPGVVFERDGRAAGYAAARDGGGTILLADPEDALPAVEALVAWLAERGHHHVDSYARDTERIAWLEAHGFRHLHSAFDLHRDVDPPPPAPAWPDGIALASYDAGADAEAVHALVFVDAAWAEVPGHLERSLESWRTGFGPGYAGLVARRDGRPVGWVAFRVFEDGRGWVEQLAVARSERGRGLGRALLLHALAALLEEGAATLALGVQGANDTAIRLYRDVGFTVDREWRSYARPA
jgi:ribosomal protein S18 acetylase RimI-like enzyme